MLQRLLAEFLHHEGVEQALVFDDRGRMLSSVAKQGVLPATEQAVDLTVLALAATQHTNFGELHEVWLEGDQTTLIDVITPYRILMLQGKQSKVARWRHAVDHMRKQLATTPEF
jgi:hypothetical protein